MPAHRTCSARPKPQRLLRYTPPIGESSEGHVRIIEGKSVKQYWHREFRADGGRGFVFEQYSPERVSYEAFVSADPKTEPHSCSCLGHLRWGHRTACRHIAASLVLIQQGKLPS